MAIKVTESDLAPQVTVTASLRQKMELEVEEEESAIQRSREKNEFRTQQLTRGAKLYKKLGLSFERVSDDWLKLVFNMIDPADETKEVRVLPLPLRLLKLPFSFILWSASTKMINTMVWGMQIISTVCNAFALVKEISPPLENVQPLIDQLNSSNNFSAFVRQIRKRFKNAYT